LPTQAGINTGVFFVSRDSTWITRRSRHCARSPDPAWPLRANQSSPSHNGPRLMILASGFIVPVTRCDPRTPVRRLEGLPHVSRRFARISAPIALRLRDRGATDVRWNGFVLNSRLLNAWPAPLKSCCDSDGCAAAYASFGKRSNLPQSPQNCTDSKSSKIGSTGLLQTPSWSRGPAPQQVHQDLISGLPCQTRLLCRDRFCAARE